MCTWTRSRGGLKSVCSKHFMAIQPDFIFTFIQILDSHPDSRPLFNVCEKALPVLFFQSQFHLCLCLIYPRNVSMSRM